MAKIRVLLDACVLIPYQLADLLLRLAEAEMFEPLWSEDILDEVHRNLVEKFNVPPHNAARRLNRMGSAFPHAVVEGYADLVAAMTTHPKDRHVAAAAVRGHAALIVTANLHDFPPDALQQYNIEAIHPDEFLQDQLDLSPEATMTCLQQQRAAYTRPQFTLTEFYLSLARTVPSFTHLAASAEADTDNATNPGGPMPLEIAPESEARQAFFPNGDPEPSNPLGAAYLWWTALLNKYGFRTALNNLTWHPPAWGDFEEPLQQLSGAGIAQFVERCPGDDNITYIKFIPNVSHTMRAFDDAPLEQIYILTMVLCPDGLWRAWGLSKNHFPTSTQVRGEQS